MIGPGDKVGSWRGSCEWNIPGAMYHVMSRSDRRKLIFKDDQDREDFLATLAETCGKTGWKMQAEILVREELKRLKWGEAELGWRPKADASKVALLLMAILAYIGFQGSGARIASLA